MGEIFRNLGNIEIKESLYKLELNYPSGKEKEYSVHIQGESSRMELSYSEFLELYYGLISSYKLLRSYKKNKWFK